MKNGLDAASVKMVKSENAARSNRWFDRPQAGAMLEASTGREALRVAEERQPGLVLMDARMPEMDGLQATLELKVKWPHIKVVVLSMYGDYETEALAAGANAFVGKGEPPDRLLAVLTALMSDVKDLPPAV